MSKKVVIVDYGVGNLLSVRRSLEHVGAEVELCSDAEALALAPRIILPGVGAFPDGMNGLRRFNLDIALREAAQRGAPILGICLGMQMLFDSSEEHGHCAGIGLIPGRVVRMSGHDDVGVQRKIPHIGWSEILYAGGRESWRGTILGSVAQNSSVYFLHSFMALPDHPRNSLASCLYGGQAVIAAVTHDNISGCQFHPEKSGQVGLSVMRQFIGS